MAKNDETKSWATKLASVAERFLRTGASALYSLTGIIGEVAETPHPPISEGDSMAERGLSGTSQTPWDDEQGSLPPPSYPVGAELTGGAEGTVEAAVRYRDMAPGKDGDEEGEDDMSGKVHIKGVS